MKEKFKVLTSNMKALTTDEIDDLINELLEVVLILNKELKSRHSDI